MSKITSTVLLWRSVAVVLAVSINCLICVCTKVPEDLNRNNPYDPGNLNWQGPVVTAMNDTTVNIADSITITATATDDGIVVKYVWANNGTTYSDTTDSGFFKAAWPDSGYKVVRVRAIDNDGVASLPDSCVIIVLVPFTDSGLLAYWSFDTSIGNTFYDMTGHGYNAIASGSGVGLAQGVKGQALSLPGSGYEVYVANSKDDFYLSNFSIETWYYSNVWLSSIINYAQIFSYNYIQSGVANGYSLALYNNNSHFFLSIANSGGSSWSEAPSTVAMSPGIWYHVVGTFDGSSMKMYVNGVLNWTCNKGDGYDKPTIDARIGCMRLMNDSNAVYLQNGYIDELKLYSYALRADSIAAHYNASKP